MRITGIGINADATRLDGSLDQLENDLAFFQQCGFDAVELSLHGLDVVIHGRVQQGRLDRLQAITERYGFVYSVHPAMRINLAFPQRGRGGAPELGLEKDTFAAYLEACGALGARVMVYHSGLIALYEFASGLGPLPDDDELEAARAQEVSALRELMPVAASRGVVVGMENRDPHPWEVATLRRAGLGPEELPKYHGGMSIPTLVRQVREVDHPKLGLTLDVGHLFLAANQCAFDFLEAISEAAPCVCHLHGSDNFGRLGSVFNDLTERIPYGDGDLHLPPGWGAIPYVQALSRLGDYEGLYVLEIQPRFVEYLAEVVETIRQIVDQATDARGR